MIIRQRRWLLAAVIFVVTPLMGLAIGATVGGYLSYQQGVEKSAEPEPNRAVLQSAKVTLPNGQDVGVAELAPGRVTAIVVMKDAHCPVCQRQLRALSKRLDEVQQAGGAVVGLSDGSLCENRRLMQRLGLGFPVVSDHDKDLLRSLGMTDAQGKRVVPGVIIVNEQGQIETVYKGRAPNQPQEEMILERLRRR